MQPGSGATLLDPKTFQPLSGGAAEFVELMNSSCDYQDFKLLKECCDTAREWYCFLGQYLNASYLEKAV